MPESLRKTQEVEYLKSGKERIQAPERPDKTKEVEEAKKRGK
jgi:hypothetical protein